MKVRDLFQLKNGLVSSGLAISQIKNGQFSLPFVRPSSQYSNLVAGYLDPSKIDKSHIFEKDSIIVSTNGQGSHSYSYVCSFQFVPNSDVAVLIPKKPMDIKLKIFYAMCITKNRFKFSYGRKPKGKRLDNIELPQSIPSWVASEGFIDVDNISKPILQQTVNLNLKSWKKFKYSELFNIERGKGPRKKNLTTYGKIPFVTSSDINNGWSGFTTAIPTHKANTIGVNRNGSVGSAFYQPLDFCSTEDVHIFNPKFQMNKYIAMFLISVIQKEKYRYNYGRKWGIGRMNESEIKLPITTEGKPDWNFVETFVKSLPYSLSL